MGCTFLKAGASETCATGLPRRTLRITMMSMVNAWNLIRVITGAALISLGIVAAILPVVPGFPLVILGVTFGFTWHPKGLRAWRRFKAAVLRRLPRRRRAGS